MRITIGTFALCAGSSSNEYPDRLTIEGQENVQIAQFIRSSTSKPISRGNTLTKVSFTVVRTHASLAAAKAFALQHHADVPKTGNVAFSEDGATYYLWYGYLLSHVIEPIIGVSTTHTYHLIGGKLSTSTPPMS